MPVGKIYFGALHCNGVVKYSILQADLSTYRELDCFKGKIL